jgi:hypothetical protein
LKNLFFKGRRDFSRDGIHKSHFQRKSNIFGRWLSKIFLNHATQLSNLRLSWKQKKKKTKTVKIIYIKNEPFIKILETSNNPDENPHPVLNLNLSLRLFSRIVNSKNKTRIFEKEIHSLALRVQEKKSIV